MNLARWLRTQWDRVAGWALSGLGGVAILGGWHGVASEKLTAQQIPYVVSGGIGGLFLLGLGATIWLSSDLRDEWRKLDDIERRLPQVGSDATDRVIDPLFAPNGQAEVGPAVDPTNETVAASAASANARGRRARARQLKQP